MKARPRCTCDANATERTYGPFLGRPTHNRKRQTGHGPGGLQELGYFSFRHRQKLSPTSAQARWQVFGSADHSGADRTSDRVGATQALAEYLTSRRLRPVSRALSLMPRWLDRILLFAPPRARGLRLALDHPWHLFQSESSRLRVRPEPRQPFCHQGPCWSARDPQSGYNYQAALSGKVLVRGAPVSNFPAQRLGRRRGLAPTLAKSAIHH